MSFDSIQRSIPRSGVIEVMSRAREHGFMYGNPEWANLGQGAPQVNALEDGIERITSVPIETLHNTYAPVSGVRELREKVAHLYNTLYRTDSESQYTWENVSVVGGGRAALSRIFATLKRINVGYFIPDYASYEGLLSTFRAFTPLPIMRDSESQYRISLEDLDREIWKYHLQAVLTSNPCNPTGQLIEGEELAGWVDIARKKNCAIIFDEFYSNYVYSKQDTDHKTVSAASYVKDVDTDPILLINGLTKSWRYPGWRVCWIVGPKQMIETIDSAGSFLDGGANQPLQQAALPALEPSEYIKETKAIQRVFSEKRELVIQRLTDIGLEVEGTPTGSFYVWANLRSLPESLHNSFDFLNACLKEKVIVVPGTFFDLNPRRDRSLDDARFHTFVRISYGPEMEELQRGLDAIERVVKNG